MNQNGINPPEVIVGHNKHSYALKGFDEFDLWMQRNDALYQMVSDQARDARISDEDRLKILLYSVSKDVLACRKEMTRWDI